MQQNIVIYHGTSAAGDFYFPRQQTSPFVWFTDSFDAAARYARLRSMEEGGVPRVLKYLVRDEVIPKVLVIDDVSSYSRELFGEGYTVAISGKHSIVFKVRPEGRPARPRAHFDYLVAKGFVGFTESGTWNSTTDWVFLCDGTSSHHPQDSLYYMETVYV